jgi:hypothetical protein
MDAPTSSFRVGIRQGLSAVRQESRKQEPDEGRGRPSHSLADRLYPGGTAAANQEGNDLETFFAQAPACNPNSSLIKGVVCGIRVEDIEDPLMQKLRYLDKLIDELAKGKAMEKILRQ